MVLVVLIVFGLVVLRGFEQGDIKPLFLATPTPTRTFNSYAQEGEVHFKVGNLKKAIESYQMATTLDPNNADLWAELARIQVYSSAMKSTDAEKLAALQAGLASADKAVEVAPGSSNAHAFRAFVLDWNANPSLVGAEEAQKMLTRAEQEALAALQIDPANGLAMAFYAEISTDQLKMDQAQRYIAMAMEAAPEQMDVHRIQGYVWETLRQYSLAIQEYKLAVDIMPNMTFIYISIGKIYRHLQLWPQAMDYFAKAASINQQIGVNDPIPYLALANTYTQQGFFREASMNMQKALSLDPGNPDVYAQLGIVYQRARNYEGAIPAFECALRGCDAVKSCEVRMCDDANNPAITLPGLPLSDNTVVYYYTYGSVLSGLHKQGDNYCVQAVQVFDEIRAKYGDDEAIMRIVNVGMDICGNT